jgi:tRNA threonylcarbamoyl adenosine modification protein (Sua5/YciO/YrdC/YwlC family)
MHTKIISINRATIDETKINEICNCFLSGDVVAFPTETVYGLGALYNEPEAIKRIYTLKSRSASKPLGIYLHDLKQLDELNIANTQILSTIANELLPGPLTIILSDKNSNKVGIRFSSDPVLLTILKKLPTYIVGTSANISNMSPCSSPQEVFAQFKDSLECIVDGGITAFQQESTIIDLTRDPVFIVRYGAYYSKLCSVLKKNHIPFSTKKMILVVCTGNTCRSPMVEGYLHLILKQRKIEDTYEVDSCGIYAPLNMSASPDAIKVLRDNGIDISHHQSKSINEELIETSNKIIVMTKDHELALCELFPRAKKKIIILGIEDPIGRGLATYNNTFNEIKIRIEENISWILQ